MQFAGKVVLITGASSGIGAATAKLFGEKGASLILAGRNLDNLKKVSKECSVVRPEGPKSLCSRRSSVPPLIVTGDITNECDLRDLLDQTIERFGKLDVLVNNAGIMLNGSIENTSLEQYDQIMNTNIRCIYQLTSLAVPHLIKTEGSIVNVSSICGIRAFPGILAYCLSKAALDQFTRCVALELGPKKVRCNNVNPGVIITNIHKRAGMDEEQYQAFLKKSHETHALGRPGCPDEVARSILFLAGSDASFITGISLSCDGGKHAMCPR